MTNENKTNDVPAEKQAALDAAIDMYAHLNDSAKFSGHMKTIRAALTAPQPVADLEGLKREAAELKTVYISGSIHEGEIIADRQRFIDHLHAAGRLTTSADENKSLREVVLVQDTNELKHAFMVNWLRGNIKIPDDVKLRIIHGSADVQELKDAVRDLAKESNMHLDICRRLRNEIPLEKTPMEIKHAATIAKVKGA